jgi:hypothetical protein
MILDSANLSRAALPDSYPRRLLRRVAEQTGLSYRVSALDLSNDGGRLAVELSRLARTVTVAVEDAHEHALAADVIHRQRARVQLRVTTPLELQAEGARYWLVTVGRLLDAQQGAQLLSAIEPIVDRGGAVALLGVRYPLLLENAWRSELGTGEDTGREHEAIFLASAFERLERVSVFERCTLDVDQASAGDVELRQRLSRYLGADGLLHQVIEGHALIARREGDRTGRWS